MDSKSAVGQVVPYHPPAMEWINVFIYILTEKAELLIHPAGIILMVFIFCCTIGKLLFSKASFERENNIIATLCHEDEMHEIDEKQLSEEMIRLRAIAVRKLKQLEGNWKRKLAKRDRRIAVLKGKLKHSKIFWSDKLAEKDKVLTSLMETYIQMIARTGQMEVLYQEKCNELKHAEGAAEQHFSKWEVVCKELIQLKEEVIKWKEKCTDTDKKLSIVQESANTLARAKVFTEAKMAEMEANYKKALLKSRPRLIDLHYLIVQRLPPAARAYASAFCFTLGLNMECAGCADDKFQVTAAFRRWLECDSRVTRTWGALLVALRRDFCYDEIPATWVDDITKDLVHGGIAALPGPERFCGNCRRDFYKEHDCCEIEDDSGGIMEAKEESGIPPSKEMVVP